MQELNDLIFYYRREADERALAGKARDPMIARLHRDLADRYATLIATIEADVRTSRVPGAAARALPPVTRPAAAHGARQTLR